MLFLGIDNGASGGIAVLNGDGSIYRVDPMPATDQDLVALLEAATESRTRRCFAMLEHAHAFPGMGASGAFTYGGGYRAVQMALYCIGIPFDIVAPHKWQSVLSCLTRGDKNVSKRRAVQLFPGQKITHAIADALLIAEYGRRLRIGYGEKEKQTERQGGQAAESRADHGRAFTVPTNGGRGRLTHAEILGQAETGGASGDGADPQSAARSSVRGDRRAAGKDERRPRARTVRNR